MRAVYFSVRDGIDAPLLRELRSAAERCGFVAYLAADQPRLTVLPRTGKAIPADLPLSAVHGGEVVAIICSAHERSTSRSGVKN